jgi:hypothetical protein
MVVDYISLIYKNKQSMTRMRMKAGGFGAQTASSSYIFGPKGHIPHIDALHSCGMLLLMLL